MTPAELTRLSIADTSALLARGEVDPMELTEAYLDRIAATEPELNAYVTVDAEGARRAAERARRRIASGRGSPLCGIPLGLKDLYDVRGLPTTAGSPLLRDHVAGGDSTVAARLRAGGAVLLGKQSMSSGC